MDKLLLELLSAMAAVLRGMGGHGPTRTMVDDADWQSFTDAHDAVLEKATVAVDKKSPSSASVTASAPSKPTIVKS